MSQKEFKDRLKMFISGIGKESARSFASRAGVSPTAIQQYLSGSSLPTLDSLIAVAEALKVNLLWLATGQGPIRSLTEAQLKMAELFNAFRMTRDGHSDLLLKALLFTKRYIEREITMETHGFEVPSWLYKEIPEPTRDDILEWHHIYQQLYPTGTNRYEDEFFLVPLYEIEVSTGNGTSAPNEHPKKTLAFRRDWLHEQGFQPGHLMAVIARGDSMDPTLRDGDVLLVNTLECSARIDNIYIMNRDGLLFAKRLQRLQNGSILIKSDNPAYAEEMLQIKDINELRIIGRVIWVGRRL